MHTPINTLARSAVAVLAGLPASAQVVEVNDGETLTEADLRAGSFMGQSFTLGSGTLFGINEGGILGPVGDSVHFRGSGPLPFDFGGSAVDVRLGGTLLADNSGNGLSNVAFSAAPGAFVIGPTMFGADSTVDFRGTSLGNLRFAMGSEALIAGGAIQWMSVFDGAKAVIRGARITELTWSANAELTLEGGEFRYAGQGIDAIPQDAVPGDVFTGTFSDGSVLIQRIFPYPYETLAPLSLSEQALPDLEIDPIVAPAEQPPIGGLRPGQTLVLQEGARLPADYRAVGASIDVAGGVVERGLIVSDTDVTFSAGVLVASGGYPQALFYRSTLRIEGGDLRPRVTARFGTTIEISGGETDTVDLDSGSLRIGGGFVGFVEARGDASIEIAGGTIERVVAWDRVAVELAGGNAESVLFRDESALVIRGGTWPDGRDLAKTTTIESGSVGDAVSLPEDGTLLITGGTIGENLGSGRSSSVEISGGIIGNRLELQNNTTALITGGTIGSQFNLKGQSEAVVAGGTIGDRCTVLQGSRLTVSGGTIGDRFNLLDGSLELVVRSLQVDGTPVAIAPGERVTIAERDVALEAVLADGTPIDFFLNTDLFVQDTDYFNASAIVTALGAAPVPCGPADFAEPFATLDLADIVAFLNAFADQSSAADLDGDGSFDLDDVARFVDTFGVGCST